VCWLHSAAKWKPQRSEQSAGNFCDRLFASTTSVKSTMLVSSESATVSTRTICSAWSPLPTRREPRWSSNARYRRQGGNLVFYHS